MELKAAKMLVNCWKKMLFFLNPFFSLCMSCFEMEGGISWGACASKIEGLEAS